MLRQHMEKKRFLERMLRYAEKMNCIKENGRKSKKPTKLW